MNEFASISNQATVTSFTLTQLLSNIATVNASSLPVRLQSFSVD